MNDRFSFFGALFLLRLYHPIVLYFQELPEGPAPKIACVILALLLPACGDLALALGQGRVRHQFLLEVLGVFTGLVASADPRLVGFCLAQAGLLVLSLHQGTTRLRW